MMLPNNSKLKSIMGRHRLDVSEVAELLGCDIPTVHTWLLPDRYRNSAQMPTSTLVKLCRELGEPVEPEYHNELLQNMLAMLLPA